MSSHSLPAIPTLPPIQMPGENDELSSSLHFHSHDSIGPQQASSSFAPHDSMSSSPIVTRSSPFTTDNSVISSSSSSTDYPPQQSIRKSISVDSFVGYERENSSRSPGPRPARGNTLSAGDSSRTRISELSVDSRRRREPETVPPYARSRGASVSTTSDGHDSSVEQGFESESWKPLKRSGDKSRRGSVKGKEQARPSRRPGDLKLPSRNLPPAVPVNYTPNQFTQPPLPRDDNRRLHSTTSLQSFPRHSSLTDVISGRVRSGSLGLQANPSTRTLFVDTVQSMVSRIHFVK
ncbi:hypothetical protein BS17DRAFT_14815 [Gyrodon lividus]|nr:hypothetical protein BS17DRAFT_14815 [Gyrodon lividus]